MAQQIIKGATMLMLAVTLSLVTGIVTANAQSSHRAVATVPFEFKVGNKNFSAGRYAISSGTTVSDAIRVTGITNSKSTTRLSTTIVKSKPSPSSKLVFRRYGDSYFLSEVWSAGYSSGRKLLRSKSEKALEGQLAANTQNYERVEIALNRE